MTRGLFGSPYCHVGLRAERGTFCRNKEERLCLKQSLRQRKTLDCPSRYKRRNCPVSQRGRARGVQGQ